VADYGMRRPQAQEVLESLRYPGGGNYNSVQFFILMCSSSTFKMTVADTAQTKTYNNNKDLLLLHRRRQFSTANNTRNLH
jgi:hypothetical protein